MSVPSNPNRGGANPRSRIENQVQVASRAPRNRQKSRKGVILRYEATVKDNGAQFTTLKVREARAPQRGVSIKVAT